VVGGGYSGVVLNGVVVDIGDDVHGDFTCA